MAKKKKDAGEAGKPAAKTEAVTVRISPTAKWALELMSRHMHKPISGVFEWCIDMAGRFVEYPYPDGGSTQIMEIAKDTAEDPLAVRCVFVFRQAPNLLTHDELVIAKAIERSPDLTTYESEIFPGRRMDNPSLDVEYVWNHSDAICSIALELASRLDTAPITKQQIADLESKAKVSQ